MNAILVSIVALWFFVAPALKFTRQRPTGTFSKRERCKVIEKVKQALEIDLARVDVHVELASMYLQTAERAKALAVVDTAVKTDGRPFALSRFLNDLPGPRRMLKSLRCCEKRWWSGSKNPRNPQSYISSSV